MEDPFIYGSAQVFIGCDLQDADALGLNEDGEVQGWMDLGGEAQWTLDSIEIDPPSP